MTAEDLLKSGDPHGALGPLQALVRANPADPKLRVFLFQLLCVTGDWDRAVRQLKTAATLDPEAEAMARMYREALVAELRREKVFAGTERPGLRDDAPGWLADMARALELEITGAPGARALRDAALDAAPATPGRLNGAPFDWLADADARLGPVLEVVLNGAYVWLPFSDITRITAEPPSDLRDLVWMPVTLTLTDEAEMIGLVPTRYPGSANSGAHAMARATDWTEKGAGLGQRMLITQDTELPLLDVREVTFDAVPEAEASHG